MRYFANPSTPRVREAMTLGLIDCIITPKQGNRLPEGVTWCADNGCFGDGYPGDDAWWAWLTEKAAGNEATCLFAVAPDVVGDAWATHLRSMPWLAKIRGLGIPAAYVLQNGARADRLPWDHFDVLFIGGDDAFKLGATARAIVREAKERGKHVHMGRVNSLKRIRYANAIGCDSVDGTFIARGPNTNLPKVIGWLRDVNEQTHLFGGAA